MLEDDRGIKFELNSLPDGEPVELAQYRCEVVELSCAGHNTTRAAEFCTVWSFFSSPLSMPYGRLLH